MTSDYNALLKGYPIYIATKEIQRRKHHKKRINKKWLKRYGNIELNLMPHDEIIVDGNGFPAIRMTKKTYQELKGLGKNRADNYKWHWKERSII